MRDSNIFDDNGHQVRLGDIIGTTGNERLYYQVVWEYGTLGICVLPPVTDQARFIPLYRLIPHKWDCMGLSRALNAIYMISVLHFTLRNPEHDASLSFEIVSNVSDNDHVKYLEKTQQYTGNKPAKSTVDA